MASKLKVTAVEKQLKVQVVALYRSYRKAVKRRREVEAQRALFDFTNVVSEPARKDHEARVRKSGKPVSRWEV